MTWLKDGLEFLAGIQTPKNDVTHLVGEQPYAVNADGTLGKAVLELAPQWDAPTFNISTLSGLAALYANELDDFDKATVGFHVVDHLTVRLLSLKSDRFGQRHVYAEAKHKPETTFEFNKFMPSKRFLIDYRAGFYSTDTPSEEGKLAPFFEVIAFASNLTSDMSFSVADDGFSQKIEFKGGVFSGRPMVIPPEGIPLIPWRTFRDCPPIQSRFFLRLDPVKDSIPLIALYEIDEKWKLDTMHAIGEWLKKHVPGAKVIA